MQSYVNHCKASNAMQSHAKPGKAAQRKTVQSVTCDPCRCPPLPQYQKLLHVIPSALLFRKAFARRFWKKDIPNWGRAGFIFMTLGYLLGSHVATWGDLGTPFGLIFAPLRIFWEHFGHTFCVKRWNGRQRCPKRRQSRNKLIPFCHLLVPQLINIVSEAA